jgi:N-acetyl-alpha-D-glucosaminyl L-malate synthase BshA
MMADVAETHRLDVLHVHYAMPFAASAFLAKQLIAPRRLPVVTTLHGTDITVVGQQPAFFRMTKFSIESSDRVTAVSQALKDATIETLGIAKPIEVIPNFVDPEVFAPRKRRAQLLAPPGARVLMHASNFRPVKNVEMVVRIFAAVHDRMDARLVMVGDGPEKPRAEQLARARRRGTCCSSQPGGHGGTASLADVFLLPSSTSRSASSRSGAERGACRSWPRVGGRPGSSSTACPVSRGPDDLDAQCVPCSSCWATSCAAAWGARGGTSRGRFPRRPRDRSLPQVYERLC